MAVVVVAGFAVAVVVVVVVVAGFAVVVVAAFVDVAVVAVVVVVVLCFPGLAGSLPLPRISEVRKVFEQLASITTSIELRSQKKII